MKFRYTVPAGMLAATILLSGCSKGGEDAAGEAVQTAKASTAPSPSPSASPAASQADFTSAISQYREYVIAECDEFVKQTEAFVQAVKAGKMEEAKNLYAPARMHYERIEPIAEALGDLDPNIDAREGDVDDSEWRGFHRIEKLLWQDGKTAGAEEYADRLLSDAQLLRAKVETASIDASLLVTGAVELLNEVSTSKVTGEEERYSHTDLYDFAANVEGAEKIYELLKPQLEQQDPELSQTISERFKALYNELAPFKQGDGYASYTLLKQDEVRKLSQNLDALAEPLSNMGTILGV
ncbi:Iron uptake system component EfeO precursor [compost metagenome]